MRAPGLPDQTDPTEGVVNTTCSVEGSAQTTATGSRPLIPFTSYDVVSHIATVGEARSIVPLTRYAGTILYLGPDDATPPFYVDIIREGLSPPTASVEIGSSPRFISR